MSRVFIQKFKEDEQIILGVVLEPTTPENPDLHNDFYDEVEVRKACNNFNENCMQTNVEHIFQLPDETATITKSFIMPIDCMIDDQIVKAGSWLQEWKIHSDELWSMVKKGEFTGFSIGSSAKVEDYDMG